MEITLDVYLGALKYLTTYGKTFNIQKGRENDELEANPNTIILSIEKQIVPLQLFDSRLSRSPCVCFERNR